MDNNQRQEWRAHNQTLQQAYNEYNVAHVGKSTSQQKAKDDALQRIQRTLEWPPFLNYVLDNGGFDPSGIRKYGIDSQTERCMKDINSIACGEMEYDY